MQFSPKLKRVMAEIQAILDKEEIGGLIVLHLPGHCEYNAHLTPPYVCLRRVGDGYRLQSKKEDYANQEAKREAEANTANMLELIGMAGSKSAIEILNMSEAVNAALGTVRGKIENFPSNYWDN